MATTSKHAPDENSESIPSATGAPISRHPFRVAIHRRPVATTATNTTHSITIILDNEKLLENIEETDSIEGPSITSRSNSKSRTIERRPLISLKVGQDQNPAAMSEEEKNRQSKSYSSSSKQSQLDEVLNIDIDPTTNGKFTVERSSKASKPAEYTSTTKITNVSRGTNQSTATYFEDTKKTTISQGETSVNTFTGTNNTELPLNTGTSTRHSGETNGHTDISEKFTDTSFAVRPSTNIYSDTFEETGPLATKFTDANTDTIETLQNSYQNTGHTVISEKFTDRSFKVRPSIGIYTETVEKNIKTPFVSSDNVITSKKYPEVSLPNSGKTTGHSDINEKFAKTSSSERPSTDIHSEIFEKTSPLSFTIHTSSQTTGQTNTIENLTETSSDKKLSTGIYSKTFEKTGPLTTKYTDAITDTIAKLKNSDQNTGNTGISENFTETFTRVRPSTGIYLETLEKTIKTPTISTDSLTTSKKYSEVSLQNSGQTTGQTDIKEKFTETSASVRPSTYIHSEAFEKTRPLSPKHTDAIRVTAGTLQNSGQTTGHTDISEQFTETSSAVRPTTNIHSETFEKTKPLSTKYTDMIRDTTLTSQNSGQTSGQKGIKEKFTETSSSVKLPTDIHSETFEKTEPLTTKYKEAITDTKETLQNSYPNTGHAGLRQKFTESSSSVRPSTDIYSETFEKTKPLSSKYTDTIRDTTVTLKNSDQNTGRTGIREKFTETWSSVRPSTDLHSETFEKTRPLSLTIQNSGEMTRQTSISEKLTETSSAIKPSTDIYLEKFEKTGPLTTKYTDAVTDTIVKLQNSDQNTGYVGTSDKFMETSSRIRPLTGIYAETLEKTIETPLVSTDTVITSKNYAEVSLQKTGETAGHTGINEKFTETSSVVRPSTDIHSDTFEKTRPLSFIIQNSGQKTGQTSIKEKFTETSSSVRPSTEIQSETFEKNKPLSTKYTDVIRDTTVTLQTSGQTTGQKGINERLTQTLSAVKPSTDIHSEIFENTKLLQNSEQNTRHTDISEKLKDTSSAVRPSTDIDSETFEKTVPLTTKYKDAITVQKEQQLVAEEQPVKQFQTVQRVQTVQKAQPVRKDEISDINRVIRPIGSNNYYDDNEEKVIQKYEEETKVILNGKAPPVSRRPFRVASRRRPVATTNTTSTTNTTQSLTNILDKEEFLQNVKETDSVTKNQTTKGRPLISLKIEQDQNPAGTSAEEKNRLSYNYRSSFKQSQLDEVLRLKAQDAYDVEIDPTTNEKFTVERAFKTSQPEGFTATTIIKNVSVGTNQPTATYIEGSEYTRVSQDETPLNRFIDTNDTELQVNTGIFTNKYTNTNEKYTTVQTLRPIKTYTETSDKRKSISQKLKPSTTPTENENVTTKIQQKNNLINRYSSTNESYTAASRERRPSTKSSIEQPTNKSSRSGITVTSVNTNAPPRTRPLTTKYTNAITDTTVTLQNSGLTTGHTGISEKITETPSSIRPSTDIHSETFENTRTLSTKYTDAIRDATVTLQTSGQTTGQKTINEKLTETLYAVKPSIDIHLETYENTRPFSTKYTDAVRDTTVTLNNSGQTTGYTGISEEFSKTSSAVRPTTDIHSKTFEYIRPLSTKYTDAIRDSTVTLNNSGQTTGYTGISEEFSKTSSAVRPTTGINSETFENTRPLSTKYTDAIRDSTVTLQTSGQPTGQRDISEKFTKTSSAVTPTTDIHSETFEIIRPLSTKYTDAIRDSTVTLNNSGQTTGYTGISEEFSKTSSAVRPTTDIHTETFENTRPLSTKYTDAIKDTTVTLKNSGQVTGQKGITEKSTETLSIVQPSTKIQSETFENTRPLSTKYTDVIRDTTVTLQTSGQTTGQKTINEKLTQTLSAVKPSIDIHLETYENTRPLSTKYTDAVRDTTVTLKNSGQTTGQRGISKEFTRTSSAVRPTTDIHLETFEKTRPLSTKYTNAIRDSTVTLKNSGQTTGYSSISEDFTKTLSEVRPTTDIHSETLKNTRPMSRKYTDAIRDSTVTLKNSGQTTGQKGINERFTKTSFAVRPTTDIHLETFENTGPLSTKYTDVIRDSTETLKNSGQTTGYTGISEEFTKTSSAVRPATDIHSETLKNTRPLSTKYTDAIRDTTVTLQTSGQTTGQRGINEKVSETLSAVKPSTDIHWETFENTRPLSSKYIDAIRDTKVTLQNSGQTTRYTGVSKEFTKTSSAVGPTTDIHLDTFENTRPLSTKYTDAVRDTTVTLQTSGQTTGQRGINEKVTETLSAVKPSTNIQSETFENTRPLSTQYTDAVRDTTVTLKNSGQTTGQKVINENFTKTSSAVKPTTDIHLETFENTRPLSTKYTDAISDTTVTLKNSGQATGQKVKHEKFTKTLSEDFTKTSSAVRPTTNILSETLKNTRPLSTKYTDAVRDTTVTLHNSGKTTGYSGISEDFTKTSSAVRPTTDIHSETLKNTRPLSTKYTDAIRDTTVTLQTSGQTTEQRGINEKVSETLSAVKPSTDIHSETFENTRPLSSKYIDAIRDTTVTLQNSGQTTGYTGVSKEFTKTSSAVRPTTDIHLETFENSRPLSTKYTDAVRDTTVTLQTSGQTTGQNTINEKLTETLSAVKPSIDIHSETYENTRPLSTKYTDAVRDTTVTLKNSGQTTGQRGISEEFTRTSSAVRPTTDIHSETHKNTRPLSRKYTDAIRDSTVTLKNSDQTTGYTGISEDFTKTSSAVRPITDIHSETFENTRPLSTKYTNAIRDSTVTLQNSGQTTGYTGISEEFTKTSSAVRPATYIHSETLKNTRPFSTKYTDAVRDTTVTLQTSGQTTGQRGINEKVSETLSLVKPSTDIHSETFENTRPLSSKYIDAIRDTTVTLQNSGQTTGYTGVSKEFTKTSSAVRPTTDIHLETFENTRPLSTKYTDAVRDTTVILQTSGQTTGQKTINEKLTETLSAVKPSTDIHLETFENTRPLSTKYTNAIRDSTVTLKNSGKATGYTGISEEFSKTSSAVKPATYIHSETLKNTRPLSTKYTDAVRDTTVTLQTSGQTTGQRGINEKVSETLSAVRPTTDIHSETFENTRPLSTKYTDAIRDSTVILKNSGQATGYTGISEEFTKTSSALRPTTDIHLETFENTRPMSTKYTDAVRDTTVTLQISGQTTGQRGINEKVSETLLAVKPSTDIHSEAFEDTRPLSSKYIDAIKDTTVTLQNSDQTTRQKGINEKLTEISSAVKPSTDIHSETFKNTRPLSTKYRDAIRDSTVTLKNSDQTTGYTGISKEFTKTSSAVRPTTDIHLETFENTRPLSPKYTDAVRDTTVTLQNSGQTTGYTGVSKEFTKTSSAVRPTTDIHLETFENTRPLSTKYTDAVRDTTVTLQNSGQTTGYTGVSKEFTKTSSAVRPTTDIHLETFENTRPLSTKYTDAVRDTTVTLQTSGQTTGQKTINEKLTETLSTVKPSIDIHSETYENTRPLSTKYTDAVRDTTVTLKNSGQTTGQRGISEEFTRTSSAVRPTTDIHSETHKNTRPLSRKYTDAIRDSTVTLKNSDQTTGYTGISEEFTKTSSAVRPTTDIYSETFENTRPLSTKYTNAIKDSTVTLKNSGQTTGDTGISEEFTKTSSAVIPATDIHSETLKNTRPLSTKYTDAIRDSTVTLQPSGQTTGQRGINEKVSETLSLVKPSTDIHSETFENTRPLSSKYIDAIRDTTVTLQNSGQTTGYTGVSKEFTKTSSAVRPTTDIHSETHKNTRPLSRKYTDAIRDSTVTLKNFDQTTGYTGVSKEFTKTSSAVRPTTDIHLETFENTRSLSTKYTDAIRDSTVTLQNSGQTTGYTGVSKEFTKTSSAVRPTTDIHLETFENTRPLSTKYTDAIRDSTVTLQNSGQTTGQKGITEKFTETLSAVKPSTDIHSETFEKTKLLTTKYTSATSDALQNFDQITEHTGIKDNFTETSSRVRPSTEFYSEAFEKTIKTPLISTDTVIASKKPSGVSRSPTTRTHVESMDKHLELNKDNVSSNRYFTSNGQFKGIVLDHQSSAAKYFGTEDGSQSVSPLSIKYPSATDKYVSGPIDDIRYSTAVYSQSQEPSYFKVLKTQSVQTEKQLVSEEQPVKQAQIAQRIQTVQRVQPLRKIETSEPNRSIESIGSHYNNGDSGEKVIQKYNEEMKVILHGKESIENASITSRSNSKNRTIQRNPLISMKVGQNENPTATSEEEKNRQSKSYSSNFNQNHLDEVQRLKAQGSRTFKVESYSAETILPSTGAIKASQPAGVTATTIINPGLSGTSSISGTSTVKQLSTTDENTIAHNINPIDERYTDINKENSKSRPSTIKNLSTVNKYSGVSYDLTSNVDTRENSQTLSRIDSTRYRSPSTAKYFPDTETSQTLPPTNIYVETSDKNSQISRLNPPTNRYVDTSNRFIGIEGTSVTNEYTSSSDKTDEPKDAGKYTTDYLDSSRYTGTSQRVNPTNKFTVTSEKFTDVLQGTKPSTATYFEDGKYTRISKDEKPVNSFIGTSNTELPLNTRLSSNKYTNTNDRYTTVQKLSPTYTYAETSDKYKSISQRTKPSIISIENENVTTKMQQKTIAANGYSSTNEKYIVASRSGRPSTNNSTEQSTTESSTFGFTISGAYTNAPPRARPLTTKHTDTITDTTVTLQNSGQTTGHTGIGEKFTETSSSVRPSTEIHTETFDKNIKTPLISTDTVISSKKYSEVSRSPSTSTYVESVEKHTKLSDDNDSSDRYFTSNGQYTADKYVSGAIDDVSYSSAGYSQSQEPSYSKVFKTQSAQKEQQLVSEEQPVKQFQAAQGVQTVQRAQPVGKVETSGHNRAIGSIDSHNYNKDTEERVIKKHGEETKVILNGKATSGSIPPTTAAPVSRRPLRVVSRRRPVASTNATSTYNTTQSTTNILDRVIERTDSMADPSITSRSNSKNRTIQSRPLISLKVEQDQNSFAVGEEQKNRRRTESKSYSSSLKQNQQDEVQRLKAQGSRKFTVESHSAETMLPSTGAIKESQHAGLTATTIVTNVSRGSNQSSTTYFEDSKNKKVSQNETSVNSFVGTNNKELPLDRRISTSKYTNPNEAETSDKYKSISQRTKSSATSTENENVTTKTQQNTYPTDRHSSANERYIEASRRGRPSTNSSTQQPTTESSTFESVASAYTNAPRKTRPLIIKKTLRNSGQTTGLTDKSEKITETSSTVRLSTGTYSEALEKNIKTPFISTDTVTTSQKYSEVSRSPSTSTYVESVEKHTQLSDDNDSSNRYFTSNGQYTADKYVSGAIDDVSYSSTGYSQSQGPSYSKVFKTQSAQKEQQLVSEEQPVEQVQAIQRVRTVQRVQPVGKIETSELNGAIGSIDSHIYNKDSEERVLHKYGEETKVILNEKETSGTIPPTTTAPVSRRPFRVVSRRRPVASTNTTSTSNTTQSTTNILDNVIDRTETSGTIPPTTAPVSRRPFRVVSRRRPVASTNTISTSNTTQSTTNILDKVIDRTDSVKDSSDRTIQFKNLNTPSSTMQYVSTKNKYSTISNDPTNTITVTSKKYSNVSRGKNQSTEIYFEDSKNTRVSQDGTSVNSFIGTNDTELLLNTGIPTSKYTNANETKTSDKYKSISQRTKSSTSSTENENVSTKTQQKTNPTDGYSSVNERYREASRRRKPSTIISTEQPTTASSTSGFTATSAYTNAPRRARPLTIKKTLQNSGQTTGLTGINEKITETSSTVRLATNTYSKTFEKTTKSPLISTDTVTTSKKYSQVSQNPSTSTYVESVEKHMELNDDNDSSNRYFTSKGQYTGIVQDHQSSTAKYFIESPSSIKYPSTTDKYLSGPIDDVSYSTAGYTQSQKPSNLKVFKTQSVQTEHQIISEEQPVKQVQTAQRVQPMQRVQPVRKIETSEPNRVIKPIGSHNYNGDNVEKVIQKYEEETKVILQGKATSGPSTSATVAPIPRRQVRVEKRRRPVATTNSTSTTNTTHSITNILDSKEVSQNNKKTGHSAETMHPSTEAFKESQPAGSTTTTIINPGLSGASSISGTSTVRQLSTTNQSTATHNISPIDDRHTDISKENSKSPPSTIQYVSKVNKYSGVSYNLTSNSDTNETSQTLSRTGNTQYRRPTAGKYFPNTETNVSRGKNQYFEDSKNTGVSQDETPVNSFISTNDTEPPLNKEISTNKYTNANERYTTVQKLSPTYIYAETNDKYKSTSQRKKPSTTSTENENVTTKTHRQETLEKTNETPLTSTDTVTTSKKYSQVSQNPSTSTHVESVEKHTEPNDNNDSSNRYFTSNGQYTGDKYVSGAIDDVSYSSTGYSQSQESSYSKVLKTQSAQKEQQLVSKEQPLKQIQAVQRVQTEQRVQPVRKIETSERNRAIGPIGSHNYNDNSEEGVIQKYEQETKVILNGTATSGSIPPTTAAPVTRRPFRVVSRRRPVTSTSNTTQSTTNILTTGHITETMLPSTGAIKESQPVGYTVTTIITNVTRETIQPTATYFEDSKNTKVSQHETSVKSTNDTELPLNTGVPTNKYTNTNEKYTTVQKLSTTYTYTETSDKYKPILQEIKPSTTSIENENVTTKTQQKIIPTNRYSSTNERYTEASRGRRPSTNNSTEQPTTGSSTFEFTVTSNSTHDDDQSPVTSNQPSTTTRKVTGKKTVFRRISTTASPSSTTTTTTPRPRRVVSKEPFEKIQREKQPVQKEQQLALEELPVKQVQPTQQVRRVQRVQPVRKVETSEPNRAIVDRGRNDDYNDSKGKVIQKQEKETKVIVHGRRNIECLEIGNFPHPSSCKKFITCARTKYGTLRGTEYTCPTGLLFDPVNSMCNWPEKVDCNGKKS